MNIFPKTNSTALRLVLIMLVFGCIFGMINSIRLTLSGDYFKTVGIIFWLLLAVGLWILNPLARTVTQLILWGIVLLVPIGMINPFAAINDYGPTPPDVWELILWIYPFVLIALYALHILGKNKKEFKFSRS